MQATRSCSRRPRIRRAHGSPAQADYSAWCSRHWARGRRTVTFINRYYDPTTAQFVSVDPDVAQTNQAYVYAGDDSVNVTDPSGAFSNIPEACLWFYVITCQPTTERFGSEAQAQSQLAVELSPNPRPLRDEYPVSILGRTGSCRYDLYRPTLDSGIGIELKVGAVYNTARNRYQIAFDSAVLANPDAAFSSGREANINQIWWMDWPDASGTSGVSWELAKNLAAVATAHPAFQPTIFYVPEDEGNSCIAPAPL